MPRLQQVLQGMCSVLSKNKPQDAQRTRLPITIAKDTEGMGEEL